MSETITWCTEPMSEADRRSLIAHLDSCTLPSVHTWVGNVVTGMLRVSGLPDMAPHELTQLLDGWKPQHYPPLISLMDCTGVSLHRWIDGDLDEVGRLVAPQWRR